MAAVWADLLTDVAVLGTNSDWPTLGPPELAGSSPSLAPS